MGQSLNHALHAKQSGGAAIGPELPSGHMSGHGARAVVKPSAPPANRAVQALEEEMARLRGEHSKLVQAIHSASAVQRMLCAPRLFVRNSVEIACDVFAVRHLSGDFCKVLDLGSDLGLVVGDIAGKGISAGLWLTHLVGLVRMHAAAHESPAGVVAAVNSDLCQLHPASPLTALFYARLNPLAGELSYCNAGQPAALLLDRQKNAEWLKEGGPLVGAMPGSAYTTGRVRLEPGETLIVCSDGITEARNLKDEEYGTRGLLQSARAAGDATATMLLYSFLGAVQDFADNRLRQDDLTLMVVKHKA